ncbi:MAG: hypothetical protein ACYC6Y_13160 [Thermoguttaceae bacterium]
MRNRRSRKFIDRKVQGRLVLGLAAHWLLFFMLILCAVPMWHMISVVGFTKPFPKVLADSWTQMTPVFIFLVTVLPIFIWETIKFSNRFVGPIYHLHQTILKIRAGEEFRPVRFRKDDFWHELADDFNTMVEHLARQKAATPLEEPADAENVVEDEPVAAL